MFSFQEASATTIKGEATALDNELHRLQGKKRSAHELLKTDPSQAAAEFAKIDQERCKLLEEKR